MIIVTDMVEVRCKTCLHRLFSVRFARVPFTVIFFFSVAGVTKQYKPKVASVFFAASVTKPLQEIEK